MTMVKTKIISGMKSVLSDGIGLLAGMVMFLVLYTVLSGWTDNILITGGLNGVISLFFGIFVNVFLDKLLKISDRKDV